MNITNRILLGIVAFLIILTSDKPEDIGKTKETKPKGERFQQYITRAFGIVATIAILILIVLDISFVHDGQIESLEGLRYFSHSIAAAFALFAALFNNRSLVILAIMFFVFGMFFELFALLSEDNSKEIREVIPLWMV
ncbi:MAG: hypothetical protein GY861_01405 [bacterium]|nr:hypothetical protein [bacterium]